MAQFKNRTFEDQRMVLDGHEYDGCTFQRCELVYAGGKLPSLTNNNFDQCRWTFDGAAARTLAFLSGMYRGGGKELIEQTFETVRRGGGDVSQRN